ncbi:hypothetical protein SNEBB_004549, partial [Seison nebaliae]
HQEYSSQLFPDTFKIIGYEIRSSKSSTKYLLA